MKIKMFTLIGVAALLATVTPGCVSTSTVETMTPVKQADGSYTTNWVKVVTAKHQDPLKDKSVRFTESMVGFRLNVSPAPTGVSGGLSPFSLIFGKQKMTWDTLPIYAGVSVGYTPPYAVSGSGKGSLWNDSDAENIGTLAGVLPTAAYTQADITPVNLLVPTTGTVTLPVTTTTTTFLITTNAAGQLVTNIVSVVTN